MVLAIHWEIIAARICSVESVERSRALALALALALWPAYQFPHSGGRGNFVALLIKTRKPPERQFAFRLSPARS